MVEEERFWSNSLAEYNLSLECGAWVVRRVAEYNRQPFSAFMHLLVYREVRWLITMQEIVYKKQLTKGVLASALLCVRRLRRGVEGRPETVMMSALFMEQELLFVKRLAYAKLLAAQLSMVFILKLSMKIKRICMTRLLVI
jgi:hypothetical protein